ncbi:hypothetical protein LEMA_P108320.1 [Plenodomus lingam JN3]|uniref:Uncharacterized protein n=1 Tax=Leptosphaeria maculans (strain JN3 / isolate v23.1.3 / race Av1-4-5-6-7-8) TaxID=985895 RepID=E4ZYP1_LEPMJ|nr:hypothetical protein LEMA_P108320.1 [Plenodomus lingam JN3]CBX96567.1 hypothetical protein LEMA_P108320.1 [Plenodomus lingam JN3]
MSSDQPIGAPFTLATLSKAVASSYGRVHAAGVCSISGIKKRKRTEIAVGLNGEGVSIYSLVTSYALPPSATFNAAPYSIYRKGTSRTPTCRFTYASLTGSISAEKPQLVCFHEETLGENTETTKTFCTPSTTAQVLSLESLPVPASGATSARTHDLLVTYDDGDVLCLSADLQTKRWSVNLKSLLSSGASNVQLEHVSLASARAVTRGLLQSREDIAAILDPTPDAASDLLDLTQVICLVGRFDKNRRIVALLQVYPRSQDLPTSRLSPVKHLITWNLPGTSSTPAYTTEVPQSAFHASSGILHTLIGGTLLTYDLSGTIPKLTSELSMPGVSLDAFLRISQDVIFTTTQNTCRVFDSKYKSLQALLSVDHVSATADPTSPSRKRKHAIQEEAAQTISPCHLIAFYADLGLVVATRGGEIFGMQYGSTLTRKRVKTEGTLLIDAIGKGLACKPKFSMGVDAQAWRSKKIKLGKHASKGKIAKFEEAFAASLGIELEGSSSKTKKANEQNGGPLTNGIGPKIPDVDAMTVDNINNDEDEDSELRTWRMPKSVPHSQQQQYRQHALFALSKIFRWVAAHPSHDEPQGHLKVDFFPPNVFQWLLQIGQLTKESIRRAIIEESPESIQAASIIVDGDIVKALVDFDPDLHILSAVLNHSQFLPAGEVVQSIKLLMQSLDDNDEENEAMKLLTSGNNEDEMDLDITSELEAASHEIEHALAVLDHGLATRSHTLRPALIRLHTFPAPVVSATLRSMLPRRDLESLIRLLHLELRNGGWTSSYDFNSDSAFAESSAGDPDDHAVTIIASLLSSTLDAIGAGAWLASVGTLSTSETSEDIIQSLHTDTSEALNGFWEARYMRGLLSEFLRYASTVPKSQRPSNKKLEQQGKPFPVMSKLDRDEDLPMLPLGGKADMGIERMKKGHGGKKEERSKREMGMLISKRVPKYSFERIVI